MTNRFTFAILFLISHVNLLVAQDDSRTSTTQPGLVERRVELDRVVNEEWKNGNVKSALDQGRQLLEVERGLYGEISVRVAERLTLLCNYALELNDIEQAQEFVDRAIQNYRNSAAKGSWQHFEAELLVDAIQVLIERPLSNRQELFGAERELRLALDANDPQRTLQAAEDFARWNRDFFGERHPFSIMAMAQVQSALQRLGQSDADATQLKRLQVELQQVAHPEYPHHGAILFLLAEHAIYRGDIQAGLKYTSSSIDHYALSGHSHSTTLNAAQYLRGYLLVATGQNREAVRPLRDAYNQAKIEGFPRQTIELEADQLCLALQRSARTEWDAQRWDAANGLMQEALTVATQEWGVNDYRTVDLRIDPVITVNAESWSEEDKATYAEIRSLQQQTQLNMQRSDFGDALEMAKSRQNKLTDLFGSENAETLRARFEVIDLLTHPSILGQQDHQKLVVLIQEFLKVAKRHFGKNHPFYASCCLDIAEHFGNSPQFMLELAQEAVTGYRASFTENSNEYIEALTVLGCVRARIFDDTATEQLNQAIDLWEAHPGRGGYAHCLATAALGRLYYHLGDPYEARQLLARAVELMRQNQNGNVDYDLMVALNDLGNVAGDYGRTQDALKFYREAISLFENGSLNPAAGRFGKTYSHYQSTYHWTLYNASVHLEASGDYDTATRLLEKLIGELEELFAQKSQGVHIFDEIYRDALYSQATVFAHLERFNESDALFKKVLEIINEHFAGDPLTFGFFYLKRGQAALIGSRDHARALLDRSFEEFRKIEDLDQIDPVEWGYFDTYLLRLRECYEEIRDWNRVVEVREFAASSEAVLYADSPDVLTELKAELQLARRVSQLRGDNLKSYEQLLSDTEILNKRNESEVESELLSRSDDLLLKSSETLGPYNLAMLDYARAASKFYELREEYSRAWAMSILALSCGEAQLGKAHAPRLADVTQACRLMRVLGKYQHALESAEQNVREAEQFLGDEHIDTFAARFVLAQIYADVHDHSSALPLARSASEGFRKLWGEENVEYASGIRLLGEIYYGVGEPEFGHSEIVRSNEILQRLKNASERDRLRSAAAVAVSTAVERDRQEEAQALFSEILARYEMSGRADTAEFSELLIEHGQALMRWGDVDTAAAQFKRAIEGLQSHLGNGDLLLSAHQQLGTAQRMAGDLETSQFNLQQALALQQQLYGDTSTADAKTLFQLAITEYKLGEIDAASNHVEQCLMAQQQQLSRVGQFLSDSSLSNLLGQDEQPLDLLFATMSQKELTEAVVHKAFEWTVQRKGLALDLACRLKSIEHSQSFDSKTSALIEQLRVLNQELADLTLQQDMTTTEADLATQRREKRREISEVQGLLSQRLQAVDSANFELESDADQIVSKLDSNSGYLEFLKVNRFDQGESFGYLAFLIRNLKSGIEIEFADLGDAEEIDDLIEQLREHVRRYPRMIRLSSEADQEDRYRELAQDLHERLLGPFKDSITSLKAVVISPDAGLSKVPFAALVDQSEKYLVETVDISFVSSARDLSRAQHPAGRGTLVISNPNFDAEMEERQAALEVRDESTLNLLALRGGDEVDMRSLRWKRLPGAEAEANDLRAILQSTEYQPVDVYIGDAAVEDVFKAVHAARIVHLATHGFYVPAADEDEFGFSSARSSSNLSRLRTAENPLLRSGIVLAGANRSHKSESTLQDGWVTAQEIARLDFRNTELVVLSACESGLGDMSSGQGVHGIRRAFFNAGAHSVLTTLFEVPDGETRELIRSFYEQLVSHTNRRNALCTAQRHQIQKRREENDAAHPFYWASFVLFGDVD